MLNVGLVQISNFDDIYLPYAVGMLQAYVQGHAQDPQRYQFGLPIYKPIPVRQAVDQLKGSDVVGFSVYVWNIQRSLAIAQNLKQHEPHTLIIFGGPHVPDQAQTFMAKHPFIDVCVHGEGELIFLQLLQSWPQRDWHDIPGISYWDDNQVFQTHPKAPRIKDLNQLPSPYLTGVFEPLMQAYPQEKWCVNWETNRGCPFSCTFCDWGSALQSKVFSFELSRLEQEMDWIGQHRIEFMWCCDANFGILPRDVAIARYFAGVRQRYGYPWTVIVQSAKNVTERVYQVQQILVQSGLNQAVTLSLQSLSPHTLTQIKRDNISLDSYMELQHRYAHDGIPTYTDLILGLPGETYDSFAEGLDTIIRHGQHHQIKVFYASILPNAEMGNPVYQQQHGLQYLAKPIGPPHGYPVQDGIGETQDIVVATAAMPAADWVKARVLSWMMGFLHSGRKMLQLPFILLHEVAHISYREIFEQFASEPLTAYPLLQQVQQLCHERAWQFQRGQELDTANMALDKYVPVKLVVEQLVDTFYQESHWLLAHVAQKHSAEFPLLALSEAIQINRCLFHLNMTEPQTMITEELLATRFGIKPSYNLWAFYQGVLRGENVTLYRRLGYPYPIAG